ncbi:MAG: imidazole glycerol phosphate synthase subunit HisH [Clostridiales bacterium]|jgi:glutamine amidotransferase|nr:imidazole glycerol phosphate synthase subunit HisH [Clostridiales bacterium]
MIGIIDYGMGNLRSVHKAFLHLGFEAEIIKLPEELIKCDKIVLPGVGAFGDAIKTLKSSGMDEAIKSSTKKGTFFLGICLGMQLAFEESYEGGRFEGLSLMPGSITRLEPLDKTYKIPHMGWNSLIIRKRDPLFKSLSQAPFMYFDHAYCLKTDSDIASADCEYGEVFQAAAQSENIFATQFHPEKSGEEGLKILDAFGRLT